MCVLNYAIDDNGMYGVASPDGTAGSLRRSRRHNRYRFTTYSVSAVNSANPATAMPMTAPIGRPLLPPAPLGFDVPVRGTKQQIASNTLGRAM